MRYAKIVLYLFTALLLSCSKKEVEPLAPETPQTEGIQQPKSNATIQEARRWFEEEFVSDNNTARKGGKKALKKEPQWDRATITKRQGKDYVYVPLHFEIGHRAARGERRRLMVFEDDKGKKHAQVLYLIAHQDYLSKNKGKIRTDDFTGLALVYNWQDEYLYGVKYDKGLVTGEVSKDLENDELNSENKIKNRPLSTCTSVTIVHYSQACIGQVCYDPQEIYSESYTVCTGGGGSGTGNPSNGGNPGGGGISPNGPLGGGGGPDDCGSAIVCEDGSTNPNIDPEPEVLIFTAGPTPPDVTEYNCGQLRNVHSDDKIQHGYIGSIQDFADINNGLTRSEVINQRGYQSYGILDLPLGPNMRYIHDPLNPDVIIDLRHMLAVAYYGQGAGNSLEMIQYTGNEPSAYDHQDYFSNNLGYDFYRIYGSSFASQPSLFVTLLQEFLTKQQSSLGTPHRTRNTDPGLINQRCP